MGQKTEFNPDEWDVQDENSAEQEPSDTSITVNIKNDLSAFELDAEPLVVSEEPLAVSEEPSAVNQEPIVFDEQLLTAVEQPKTSLKQTNNSLEEKGIYISRRGAGGPVSAQEEEAFKKQIEDLFELLELEKAADKNEGVRVYQTDSSPSKPWRFH